MWTSLFAGWGEETIPRKPRKEYKRCNVSTSDSAQFLSPLSDSHPSSSSLTLARDNRDLDTTSTTYTIWENANIQKHTFNVKERFFSQHYATLFEWSAFLSQQNCHKMTPDVYLPRNKRAWVEWDWVVFYVGGKCKIPESGALGGITTSVWCASPGEDDNAVVLFCFKQVKPGQHILWFIIIISLNGMLRWSDRSLQNVNHTRHWNALKSKNNKNCNENHPFDAFNWLFINPFHSSFYIKLQ